MAERTDNRRLKQVPTQNPRVQRAVPGSVDRFAQFTANIPITNTPSAVAADLKGASQGSGLRRQSNFSKLNKGRLNK